MGLRSRGDRGSGGAGLSAGCEPLYGGKPEKLTTPVRKKPPKEEPVPEAPVKMVDECTADFRADPRTVRAQTHVSSDLTDQGTTALVNSDKATDPTAQAGLIREGIDKFRNALIKDPYNAVATLKLALAYDKVYRKGCALAMLKRLATLATNPSSRGRRTPRSTRSATTASGSGTTARTR